MTTVENTMDSRISSILLNLDLNVNAKFVENKYMTSIKNIEESIESSRNSKKVYKNLRQTLRECYLTGSLRYGQNFLS